MIAASDVVVVIKVKVIVSGVKFVGWASLPLNVKKLSELDENHLLTIYFYQNRSAQFPVRQLEEVPIDTEVTE